MEKQGDRMEGLTSAFFSDPCGMVVDKSSHSCFVTDFGDQFNWKCDTQWLMNVLMKYMLTCSACIPFQYPLTINAYPAFPLH